MKLDPNTYVMRLWSSKIVYNTILRQCLKFGSSWRWNIQERPRHLKVLLWDMFLCFSVPLYALHVRFGSNWYERFLTYLGFYLGWKHPGTLRHDFPQTTLRVLEEDHTLGSRLPKQSQTTECINAPLSNRRPIVGGVSP